MQKTRQDSPIITKAKNNLKRSGSSESNWLTASTTSDSDDNILTATPQPKQRFLSKFRKKKKRPKFTETSLKTPRNGIEDSEEFSSPGGSTFSPANLKEGKPSTNENIIPATSRLGQVKCNGIVRIASIRNLSDVNQSNSSGTNSNLLDPNCLVETEQVQNLNNKELLKSKSLNSTCVENNCQSTVLEAWDVSVIPRRATSTSSSGGSVPCSQMEEVSNPTIKMASDVDDLEHVEKPLITYTNKKHKIELDAPDKTAARPRRAAAKEAEKQLKGDPYEFSSDSDFVAKRSIAEGRYKKPSRSSKSDQHEVIEIQDDTETDDAASAAAGKTRSSAKPDNELCSYFHIRINTADYKTLEEGEFLNDNIIEFFLTHLKEEKLKNEEKQKVYMFSTHFFDGLTNAKGKSKENFDKSLTEEQRMHKRVERWTKKVNIFEKDMVIFPICEEAHWYLIIAVKPGNIKNCVSELKDEKVVRGQPFFILLDSMGGGKDRSVSKIRSYLAAEWNAKTGGTEKFSKRQMRCLKPPKPEQDNFYDCGIYLLHYVENIFKSVNTYFWNPLPNLSDWFPQEEITKKRFQIAKFIQTLAKEQKGPNVDFPQIELNMDGRRRHYRRSARVDYFEDLDFGKVLKKEKSQKKKAKKERQSKDRVRRGAAASGSSQSTSGPSQTTSSTLPSDNPENEALSSLPHLQGNYKIPRKPANDNLNQEEIKQTLDALDNQESAAKEEISSQKMSKEGKLMKDRDSSQSKLKRKKNSSPDRKKMENSHHPELSKNKKRRNSTKDDKDCTDADSNKKWKHLSKEEKNSMLESARREEKITPAAAIPGMPILVPGASNLDDMPGTSSTNARDFYSFLDKEKPVIKNKANRENFNKFLESNNVERKETGGRSGGNNGRKYDPEKYSKSSSSSRATSPTNNLSESGKEKVAAVRVQAQPTEKRRLSLERIKKDWATTDGSETEVDSQPNVPANKNFTSVQPDSSSPIIASKPRLSDAVRSLRNSMLRNEDVAAEKSCHNEEVKKSFLLPHPKSSKDRRKTTKERIEDKINGIVPGTNTSGIWIDGVPF